MYYSEGDSGRQLRWKRSWQFAVGSYQLKTKEPEISHGFNILTRTMIMRHTWCP